MNKMIDTLNKTLTNLLGWEADYYFTEKTISPENFESYEITDEKQIKVLIPDKKSEGADLKIKVIQKELKREPHLHDIVFIKNRMYQVNGVRFNQSERNYELELSKYTQIEQ